MKKNPRNVLTRKYFYVNALIKKKMGKKVQMKWYNLPQLILFCDKFMKKRESVRGKLDIRYFQKRIVEKESKLRKKIYITRIVFFCHSGLKYVNLWKVQKLV